LCVYAYIEFYPRYKNNRVMAAGALIIRAEESWKHSSTGKLHTLQICSTLPHKHESILGNTFSAFCILYL